ncbi:unnamed protein product [Rangifer tarandus platyrhynchus]|uniref:Uncharacterized protein n=2 Tax=Rangifer tarandus platyrhynchus TaxID=3082113 RepID=A0ABN8Z5R5_RANTA|nr:unnamed protein product [Rangifer tarandus platyrhynchus]CAI9703876.1 unnamed protein product [Rangifer tarandus platyrhynchus]
MRGEKLVGRRGHQVAELPSGGRGRRSVGTPGPQAPPVDKRLTSSHGPTQCCTPAFPGCTNGSIRIQRHPQRSQGQQTGSRQTALVRPPEESETPPSRTDACAFSSTRAPEVGAEKTEIPGPGFVSVSRIVFVPYSRFPAAGTVSEKQGRQVSWVRIWSIEVTLLKFELAAESFGDLGITQMGFGRGHAGFCSVALNSSPGRKTEQAAQAEGLLGDAAMGAVAVGEFRSHCLRSHHSHDFLPAREPEFSSPDLILSSKAPLPLSTLPSLGPVPRSHWPHVLSVPGTDQ